MSDYWRAVKALVPATIVFLLVILISTFGYELLGWSFADALYMVVITVFTVGYGETQPVNTPAERVWTMLVIVMGWFAVLTSLGTVVRSVTEGELGTAARKRRRKRTMNHLHDHVIIVGYGRIGQTIARELQQARVPFVVVDKDEGRLAVLREDGIVGLYGDATEESLLLEAGLLRARVLATVLPNDALNVFITLTARSLSPSVRIIARGEMPSTEKKLIQAGADEIILPATIGGLRIAHLITKPAFKELLKDARSLDFHALGVEVDELQIRHHAALLGQSVRAIQNQGAGTFMVLAVNRNGETLTQDVESLVLQEKDVLLVISRDRQLPEFLEQQVVRTELL